MVVAVPIVLQWPAEGAEERQLDELFLVDLAQCGSSRAFQTIVPDRCALRRASR
jgi:hypothetical protein